jgi:cytochrome c oxidase subunit 2
VNKIAKSFLLRGAGAIAAAGMPVVALADWELNMPVGVTPLSEGIHRLHMQIFWICVVIAVAVFGVMIYSLVKFRHAKGAVPANFDHSTRAEMIWTIIPVVILIGMSIPAAETLIRIEDMSGSKLSVKVTGYQWKWHYEYLDDKVAFFSSLAARSNAARQLHSGIDPKSVPNYLLEVDHPLVVPVNTKVRLLLTAGDVIHAWWVPAFGMKKDAIPGMVNELWFEAQKVGVYRGQCAELCGRDHGFMPIVVEVKSQTDYDAWLATQKGGVTQQQNAPTNAPVAAAVAAAE